MPDLLAAVPIQEAGRSLGASVETLSSQDELAGRLDGAALLVIDFSAEGIDLEQTVSMARTAGVPSIAFGNHQHRERRRAALAAGVSRVYNRGAFLNGLPGVLEQAVAAHR